AGLALPLVTALVADHDVDHVAQVAVNLLQRPHPLALQGAAGLARLRVKQPAPDVQVNAARLLGNAVAADVVGGDGIGVAILHGSLLAVGRAVVRLVTDRNLPAVHGPGDVAAAGLATVGTAGRRARALAAAKLHPGIEVEHGTLLSGRATGNPAPAAGCR